MSDSPEYRAWQQIVQMCSSPTHRAYSKYGGIGIKICEEWRHSFQAFFEYVGPKPDNGTHYVISRPDPTGNYEPGNCGWVTKSEAKRNSGVNHKFNERPKPVGSLHFDPILNKEVVRKKETSPGGLVWILDPCECGHQRLSHKRFESECERYPCSCGSFVTTTGLQPHIDTRKKSNKPALQLGASPRTKPKYNPPELPKTVVNGAINSNLTANGETRTLVEWSELRGIKRNTISMRLARGWSPERALGLPED